MNILWQGHRLFVSHSLMVVYLLFHEVYDYENME